MAPTKPEGAATRLTANDKCSALVSAPHRPITAKGSGSQHGGGGAPGRSETASVMGGLPGVFRQSAAVWHETP